MSFLHEGKGFLVSGTAVNVVIDHIIVFWKIVVGCIPWNYESLIIHKIWIRQEVV